LAVPGALLEYNGAHKKAQGALGQLGPAAFATGAELTNFSRGLVGEGARARMASKEEAARHGDLAERPKMMMT